MGVVGRSCKFRLESTPPSSDLLGMRRSQTTPVIALAGLCALGVGGYQYAASSPSITVIDGDTIERNGVRYRLIGFDTPETWRARCTVEYDKGIAAKNRLQDLVSSGKAKLVDTRREDKYGRGLARLYVDGKDAGRVLVSEGLARPYDGRSRRAGWCG